MVFPMVTGLKPSPRKRETSASEKPPSGPMANTAILGLILRYL